MHRRSRRDTREPEPTPELLLHAYRAGVFPMADGRDGSIGWYAPDPRAVQPFVPGDPRGDFRVRRSLRQVIRRGGFDVTTDQRFAEVVHACAQPRGDGHGTWISPGIERAYTGLHKQGHAHSVEAWHDGELVGGLYGVAIGAAFFGESMFSRMPYASQVCYVWLVEHLRSRGYALLDVQFRNPHIDQFGTVELPRDDYLQWLASAVDRPVTWR